MPILASASSSVVLLERRWLIVELHYCRCLKLVVVLLVGVSYSSSCCRSLRFGDCSLILPSWSCHRRARCRHPCRCRARCCRLCPCRGRVVRPCRPVRNRRIQPVRKLFHRCTAKAEAKLFWVRVGKDSIRGANAGSWGGHRLVGGHFFTSSRHSLPHRAHLLCCWRARTRLSGAPSQRVW